MDEDPKKNGSAVTVRRLSVEDAEDVARLSGQLGYASDPLVIRPRMEAMRDDENRIALGAAVDGKLAGWIDASVERHLQSEDVVDIGGLVVSEDARGMGIGKLLCEEIEQWTRARGMNRVRVRSQIKREDAHRFYLRDGYENVKTSLVFEKKVR